jgi:hypothetical protein
MAKEITEYTTYCGKPLVKNGNIICYGNPSKKAVLILTVLTTKDFHGKEIPDMIFVQVQDTKSGEILKQSEKFGLYEALDLGKVWLEKELKK